MSDGTYMSSVHFRSIAATGIERTVCQLSDVHVCHVHMHMPKIYSSVISLQRMMASLNSLESEIVLITTVSDQVLRNKD